MPIDTQEVRSPGWWMQRLFNMLADRRRRDRLQRLFDYHRGDAPLPTGAENAREAFQAFQAKARSNFAELIVSAMSERMTVVGFRTAVEEDVSGDAEVGEMWVRAGLDVISADVHDLMLALSEAYVIVGPVDPDTEAPLVTCEDPRTMIADVDPVNPRRILAALKVLRDDVAGQDRAYLYLPGQVHVAVRRSRPSEVLPPAGTSYSRVNPNSPPVLSFSPQAWDWDADRSGRLPHNRIPVVRFTNKYLMGEYEGHLDLLDRINHQILQRMVIATMQAFRQRAVKGLPYVYPEDHPKAGEEILWDELFTADPAALWQLPADADMWESAVNDLTPILSAVKNDLEHLAAVTRTPMHMLSPGGVNQSAEGASLVREGLVFKVKDRIARTSFPWAQVMSLALLNDGQSERADLSKLQTIWAPPEQLSLTERAQAVAQLKDLLPKRTMLITIMGMSPAEADRTMTEIEDERVLAAQVQQAMLAAAGGRAEESTASGTPGSTQPDQQPAVSSTPPGPQ